MKCRNCGAELNNGRCDYCGSFFAEDMRLFTPKKTTLEIKCDIKPDEIIRAIERSNRRREIQHDS